MKKNSTSQLTDKLAKIPRRFWAKVQKTDNCWFWIGSCTTEGYGQIKVERKMLTAHQYIWLQLHGPMANGLVLDHTCHTLKCLGGKTCIHRRCVNPSHLEPVTHRINILRGNGRAAQQARQTHCKRDHEFTTENTYLWRGMRHCRKCRIDSQRDKRRMNRENK